MPAPQGQLSLIEDFKPDAESPAAGNVFKTPNGNSIDLAEFEAVDDFAVTQGAEDFVEVPDESFFDGFASPGGFIDRNVLSGQLPAALGAAGGIAGGVLGLPVPLAGTALGGAVGGTLGTLGGLSAEQALRQTLGFDAPISTGQAFKNIAASAPEAAAYSFLPIGQGAGRAANELTRNIAPRVARQVARPFQALAPYTRGAVESVPLVGGPFKAGSKLASERARDVVSTARQGAIDASAEFTSQIGAGSRVGAANSLISTVDDMSVELGKKFKEVKDPLMKSFRGAKVADELLAPVKKQITDVLGSSGLLDDAGSILTGNAQREALKSISSPGRKAMLRTLASKSKILTEAPTVGQLDSMTQDLQSIANFNAATRTAEEKIIGGLSKVTGKALDDGLQAVAQGERGLALRGAKDTFSQGIGLINDLKATVRKLPGDNVDIIRGRITPEFLTSALEQAPKLRKPLGDVIITDILSNARTPATLEKAVRHYGEGALEQVLEPSTFKALGSLRSQFSTAFTPGKSIEVAKAIAKAEKDALGGKVVSMSRGTAFLNALARGYGSKKLSEDIKPPIDFNQQFQISPRGQLAQQ